MAHQDKYRRDTADININESDVASNRYVKSKKIYLQVKAINDQDFEIEFNTIKIKEHDCWAVSTGKDHVNDDMTERNVAGVQRNSAKPRNRSELIASAKTATIINKDNIICLKKRIRVIYHNGRGFQNLLEQAGYTMDTIHQSLKPSKNRDMVFKAGLGAGKSGSFFFFSHDCQFIIKTVKDEEFKVLMRMLPDYLEHLK